MICKFCGGNDHFSDQCTLYGGTYPTKWNQHGFQLCELVKWRVTKNCKDDFAKRIIEWLK